MKLKRIELMGFGKLVHQAYEFSPGFNLIYGPNEAGKSTLQHSISAALYGFFDEGSVTAAKKAVVAAFQPWDPQARYGVKLSFDVDDGSQYLVERTFLPRPETILYDARSGQTLNSKFRSASQGRLFFAEELLGMSRDVFENTSVVRQAELASLEASSSAITDTLLRLSASASQESTVSEAVRILETTLRERIGTPRSRNKPLPEAHRRLEALRAARSQLQDKHQALVSKIRELAQLEESLEQLQYERDKAIYQHLAAQQLMIQQQRQRIEEADREVQRQQQVVSNYQAWSTFPIDSQLKVHRLVAQLEKTRGDAQQAEDTARRARPRLLALQAKVDELRKTLKLPIRSIGLPDLEAQSAAPLSASVENWLGQEISTLSTAIQERQNTLAMQAQRLMELPQIGHEDLLNGRQELAKLRSELDQAQQAVQQVRQAAHQAGMPEDQWAEIIKEAQANADRLKPWSDFPAHLRDELLQLKAQHAQSHVHLASKSEQITQSQKELAQLNTQLDTLLVRISGLENARHIPHQEKPRIQEIASQLESEKQHEAEERQEFFELDNIYQGKRQIFVSAKKSVEPLEEIGIAGLTQLQQRWLNAVQRISLVKNEFAQAQESWTKVGMPVAEFQRLEEVVREIQEGVRPAPRPRRGCRSWFMSWFMPKRASTEDQTPSEITVYSQIQPIYEKFSRLRAEIEGYERTLQKIETELRQQLGHLIPDVVQEDTFIHLLEQLQRLQKEASELERIKGAWELRRTQYQQAESRVAQVQNRLEEELRACGIVGESIEKGMEVFLELCAQKEQLILLETNLERLQSDAKNVVHQIEQFQNEQQALAEIEGKVIDLLAIAQIKAETGSLQEGIEHFNKGWIAHYQWKDAQARLEQTQQQINEFNERLSKAQGTVVIKEKNLLDFRQQLIEKFSGLLPSDFTDQHLAQLDNALHSFRSAQAELDKAIGQFEQLKLHAESIKRDLSNWAERENASKHLESEILQAIKATGIETDEMSLDQALHSFEEAVKGFGRWQGAQRAYEAAVSAQQTMRTVVPKLEVEAADLRSKIEKLIAQHPEWKSLTIRDGPEVYEKNMIRLNEKVTQERDRMLRLQDMVSRASMDLQHLAEIDEEIDLVAAEVQQLSRFSQSLELAINELTITAQEFQKIFAPRLEQAVEDGLEQITHGRYRQVSIDPDSLNVRVLAPERNELVDTAKLSTGTRDLIYLILRIGLTELMSNSGAKLPLLLDDPLVEFDPKRQIACLEYLALLAGQTQILLFTKDDRIRDWLSDVDPNFSRSKLIDLG